ncbi:MAG: tyrosine-type recombinase/integrase [Salibacteraceae bacterium]
MMTVEKGIQDFLSHCQYEKGLSPKTLSAYRIDLRQFCEFLTEHHQPQQLWAIDRKVLRLYLEQLAQWKPKTIKRKVACLKALFNHLEFEDYIPVSPFRKMRVRIKEPRQLPVVMTQKEVASILSTAYQRKAATPKTQVGNYAEVVRNVAIIELLFATGIRVSELCSLQPEQINLQNGLIKVKGKGSKERIVQVIHPAALEALQEYALLFQAPITAQNSFFINRLGKELSTQSVRHLIRNLVKQSSLNKSITPHTFRHTFATLLLEEDVDIKYIQHFLGHSSIMTTQIYTHVNKEKQRQILEERHPRGRLEVR